MGSAFGLVDVRATGRRVCLIHIFAAKTKERRRSRYSLLYSYPVHAVITLAEGRTQVVAVIIDSVRKEGSLSSKENGSHRGGRREQKELGEDGETALRARRSEEEYHQLLMMR